MTRLRGRSRSCARELERRSQRREAQLRRAAGAAPTSSSPSATRSWCAPPSPTGAWRRCARPGCGGWASATGARGTGCGRSAPAARVSVEAAGRRLPAALLDRHPGPQPLRRSRGSAWTRCWRRTWAGPRSSSSTTPPATTPRRCWPPTGSACARSRLDENRGLRRRLQRRASRPAAGGHVVLLNNDTQPRAGLAGTCCSPTPGPSPRRAIVGCKLLWPTGAVQHAGVAIDAGKDVRHIYMGFPGRPSGRQPGPPLPGRDRRLRADPPRRVRGARRPRHRVSQRLRGRRLLPARGRARATRSTTARRPSSTTSSRPAAATRTRPTWPTAPSTTSAGRDRIDSDDVDYYVEDGLLSSCATSGMSVNFAVSPAARGRAHRARPGQRVERALDWRSRQSLPAHPRECPPCARRRRHLAVERSAPPAKPPPDARLRDRAPTDRRPTAAPPPDT